MSSTRNGVKYYSVFATYYPVNAPQLQSVCGALKWTIQDLFHEVSAMVGYRDEPEDLSTVDIDHGWYAEITGPSNLDRQGEWEDDFWELVSNASVEDYVRRVEKNEAKGLFLTPIPVTYLHGFNTKEELVQTLFLIGIATIRSPRCCL